MSKSFGCTNIHKDSYEVMQPIANSIDSRTIFLIMSTVNQVLPIPLSMQEVLFIEAWVIRIWVSLYKYLQESKVAFPTRPFLYVAGSHFSKFLSLNVSGTKMVVAPKQKYDRLLSVEEDNHATTLCEHAWATPRYTVIGGY